MDNEKSLISRRKVIASVGAIAAATIVDPASIFALGPVKRKLRFAVMGDWGNGSNGQLKVARQMLAQHRQLPLDFVITAGDNIYPVGNGRLLHPYFEVPYAGLIADRVRFYASLGNHDVAQGRHDQCHYPLFNMDGRSYYSFVQGEGLAEFFIIDSTDISLPQLGWLERALRESRARWKIAVFHHPLYSSARTHGSDLFLSKILEPLFYKYQVDLVFSGHDHTYERIKPQHGINYFVVGASGQVRVGDINLQSPLRAAHYDQSNTFLLATLSERRLTFQTITENGLIVDSGEILPR